MATIDPNTAFKVARWMSGAGPSATHAEAGATVAQLRAQAERAPGIVAEVTGLDAAAETASRVPVLVVDRSSWAKAAAQLAGRIVTPHIGEGAGRFADFMASAEVAVGVSAMASRVLGQYDPFWKAPSGASLAEVGAASLREPPGGGRLLLVAPNIRAFGAKHSLDRQDLALWICVHELAHAVQFAAAPWLRDYVHSRVKKLFAIAEDAPESLSLRTGPGGEITAIMSLLEGHAEFVMNAVPIARMPGKGRLVQAMRERREAGGPVVVFLRRVLGLDVKVAQYRDGVAFVEEVVRRAGQRGLNLAWEDPLNAPSLAEIAEPGTWVRRVVGGHAAATASRGASDAPAGS